MTASHSTHPPGVGMQTRRRHNDIKADKVGVILHYRLRSGWSYMMTSCTADVCLCVCVFLFTYMCVCVCMRVLYPPPS